MPPSTSSKSRHHRRPVAALARLAVLSVLASVLVLVPAATVKAAEAAAIDTRTPSLIPPSGRAHGPKVAKEAVPGFEMLGVTLPGPTTGPVLARARSNGRWSPWMDLEVNPDHRPEGGERTLGTRHEPGLHSDPIWFGDADAYEVSTPADVPTIQVHLVRSIVRYTTSRATEPAAGATTPVSSDGPAILDRSQWGARPPAVTPSIAPDLKLAVVHHSVNANTYSAEDVPALLRGIQAYHMDVQGWNDIAYNFAVDRFGRIWEARAGGITKAVIGGHAQGFNTFSTGVVVLGDFTSAQPSQAAVDAVADLIGWKFAHHQIDVRGTTQFTSLGSPRYPSGTVLDLPRIVGHRDVGQTGCPGSELHRRLDEIRTKAAARFDVYITQQPETPLFGDFDGDGLRDVLRYRPGARADVLWSHPGSGVVATPLTIDGTFRPVVADLDGDGRDDILWYAPGSYPGDRVWYGGPAGFTSRVVDLPEQGLPHVAELDGDGISDVIVYAPGGSPDRIYSGRADRTLAALPMTVNRTYDLSVGDFDGDGRDDLLWYGYGTNPDSFWFSDGQGRFTSIGTATASGSSIPIVGDFDGNGLDDVFFYGPGDAPDELWWSELLAPRGEHSVEPVRVRGTGYQPHVGDVNGDGADDIVWYQPGLGADPLWMWLPARIRTDRILNVRGTYVPDVGSYTGDSLDDVAWISPTTTSYLWVASGDGAFESAALG